MYPTKSLIGFSSFIIMSSKILFQLFSTFLKICGIDLNGMTCFTYVRFSTFIVLVILWCVSNILDIYLHWVSVDDLGKGLLIPMSLRNFFNMMNLLLNFTTWNSILKVCQSYYFAQEKVADGGKLMQQTMIVIKVYLVLACVALVAFVGIPMIQEKMIIPQFPLCDSHTTKCIYTINTIEVLYIFMIFLATLAFDLLYVYLILSMYFETEAIKQIILNTDVSNENTQTLNNVIGRHSSVIGLTTRIKDMYSNMLLFQYQATTFTVCIMLFLLCVEGIPPPLERFVQNAVPVTVILIQMTLYCVGGTVLKYQGLSISDALFETNWWTKTQPGNRKTLALMIQASQKPTILTIGEVMQLGLDNIVMVLRTALSIFTLMRNIQEQ